MITSIDLKKTKYLVKCALMTKAKNESDWSYSDKNM